MQSISKATLVALLALSGSLSACGGFALFGREEVVDESQHPAVLAHRDRLASVSGDADTAAALADLGVDIGGADGKRREALRNVRGEALFDLAVYAYAVEAQDPFGADAAFDILSDVTGVSPLSDGFELAVALAIEEDLRLGGVSTARAQRARALLAPPDDLAQPERLFLRWADDDPWIAPRAHLMALRSAARQFGTWSRRGTGGGGEALVMECGFLCGVDDRPTDLGALAVDAGYACHRDTPTDPDDTYIADLYEARPDWVPYSMLRRCGRDAYAVPVYDGALPLLSPENHLDAVALRAFNELVDAAVLDLEQGARASRAAGDFVRDVATRVRSAAVPLSVTANLVTGDPTLELPEAFERVDPGNRGRLGQEPRLRILVVHSDGMELTLRPQLRYRPGDDGAAGMIELAERPLGLQWPGERVLTFDGPGAVAAGDVVDSRVPTLSAAMVELESLLAEQVWVAIEEHPSRLRDGSSVPVSLIVDGDTYLTTLEPIVATLHDAGYGPLVFHTWHPALGRLSAAPMLVEPASDAPHHILEVRVDGYVLQPWDGENQLPPTPISRAQLSPLSVLYTTIAASLADGRMDPSVPLVVVPADPTADYASLAHLVTALAWRRTGQAEEGDLELLRDSVVMIDGVPQRLVEAGVVLAW